MYGIDISNWQAGLKISDIAAQIEFAICKATEGVNFVDKYCDNFIEQLKAKNKLWGFYHFANNNNPETEAQFFYDNCKNYFGYGIPVLDIEDNSIANWKTYAEKFCNKVYQLSGIYPMIYTSASMLKQFSGSWLPEKCGLWVAGYPTPQTSFGDYDIPYSILPWKICAIWQFTSSLTLKGYSGNLDGNIAYMNEKSWNLYATGGKNGDTTNNNINNNSTSNTDNSAHNNAINTLAHEVIAGKYGNGTTRKENLYKEIQTAVNKILGA